MLDESEVFHFTDGVDFDDLDFGDLAGTVPSADSSGIPEFDESEVDKTVGSPAEHSKNAGKGTLVSDEESSKELDGNPLTSEKLGLLFDGCCVLTFQYPDGSVVESVTTLNHDLLNMHGLSHIDGVVDIEERTPIPEQMFEILRDIRPGDKKHLSPLDKFFEIGGKLGW